jgi:hypothetical protein
MKYQKVTIKQAAGGTKDTSAQFLFVLLINPSRSEEGLCLITFELVFDKFDICIEWDKGSYINCVFG